MIAIVVGHHPVRNRERHLRRLRQDHGRGERDDVHDRAAAEAPRPVRGGDGTRRATRDRVEHPRDVGRALRTRIGILFQTLHHDIGERRRRVRTQLRHGLGLRPMCAASSLCGDRSANGGRPASISYAMHPNE